MNQFVGYGPNGFYLILIDEQGRRSSAYFMQNELWIEYLSFKLGKRWVKANAQRINDILTAVINGKTSA